MSKQPIPRIHLVICALLAVAVLAIYWQTLDFTFTNYDDPVYVTENAHVQAGLTAASLGWAFTSLSGSNWHPLTWLSHMLDWQMYGNQAGLHHWTNVLIHLLNSILLFLVLSRMTGSTWSSAFVAALFAVHPLHVESVAWIAERKDVLSALFWILTLWAYVRCTETRSFKRYLPVLLLFAAGLMAKPMLVTLPFALLLFDYWPLRRLKGNIGSLLAEKIPLFALAAASGAVTYIAQQRGGSVAGLQAIPFDARVGNAIIAYVTYIGHMFWPLRLAVFYPHAREAFPAWQVAGAAVILIALTALAIIQWKKRPYVIVGWFWYIGTLVPVIGLVQVGEQASADRYTYIPLIGLFIAIAWLVPTLIPQKPAPDRRPRKAEPAAPAIGKREISLAITAAVIIVALTATARVQAGYWRDSMTLFSHALEVTTDNELAHNNLGIALGDAGRTEEAREQYREALRISPTDPDANYNYGIALAGQARYKEAVEYFQRSLQSRPDSPKALDNLGNALARLGRKDEAITYYRKTLQLDSGNPKAHNNLASALSEQGKLDEAVSEFRLALKLKPDFAGAHANLAVTLFYKDDYAGAWREVHLARKYGAVPNPGLLNALSFKMPEPPE